MTILLRWAQYVDAEAAVILSTAKDLSKRLYNLIGTLRAKNAAITAKTMLASHSQ